MSTSILPPLTAAISPEDFPEQLLIAHGRRFPIIVITLLVIAGFFLRVGGLGTESLSEDELNKLQTVDEYRTNGLSGKNGEHPFLMKGLQTVSIATSEKWNSSAPENLRIPTEAALRFPLALAGTLSILLIFLLVSLLFGQSIALVTAGLFAFEPMAVGFDRIAKEDSLVVCFFLLTQYLWIRGQTASELGLGRWAWYAWGSGAAFAALMASKYYPHLLAISAAYYNIYKHVPTNRWRMEGRRWLIFMIVMGFTFLILNPTIMLPETWHEMLKFSSENRIGHDSYEYMGELYPNQMSAWLSGVPWTFYYVFIAVKTSLPTLVFMAVGIPLMFMRRLGDGRFLIFFWAFMWFLPFTFLGGKFTRYFALVTPLIFLIASVGFCFTIKWAAERFFKSVSGRRLFESIALAALLGLPLVNSLTATPHFRLFTNTLGGGMAAAGDYFPHDEFYDAATRKTMAEITLINPRTGATVASETPGLYAYYSERFGRGDLRFVSLSDEAEVAKLLAGDVIVLAKGRRYFSNTPIYRYLDSEKTPVLDIQLAGVPAVKAHLLDSSTALKLRTFAE